MRNSGCIMKYADPDLKPSGFGETNDNSDEGGKSELVAKLANDSREGSNGLSLLQRRVLQMIADGFDTGTIAQELDLSIHAIDAALGVARSRLGATSNRHAIALAMRSGAVK